MREFFIPGASYSDASPLGDYAALIPNAHIETSRGIVPLCPAGNLLFLRMTVRGGLFLAGQGHNDGAAWLWNGGWRQVSATTGGQKVVAFGPAGLYVDVNGRDVAIIDLDTGVELARVPVSLGSGGIQYVTEAGEIVPGDAVYGPGSGRPFYESTTRGEFVVGGHGWSAGIVKGGPIRTVIPGTAPKGTTFINFQRDGELCAVAAVQQHGAAFRWFSVSDIASFPTDGVQPVPPTPDPPKPEPIPEPSTMKPDPALVDYVHRRWTEMKVQERTDALTLSAHPSEDEYREIHSGSFVRIVAEWEHVKRLGVSTVTVGFYPYEGTSYPITMDDGSTRRINENILLLKVGSKVYWQDVIIGCGGPRPQLNLGAGDEFQEGDGKFLLPPKHLAGGVPTDPVTPPVPPVDPSKPDPVQAQLDALAKRIAALEAKPSGGIDGKRIALRTAHNTYLSAQDNGDVVADRTVVKPWEVFTVEEQ
jgi:hypothetical protein